jgi:hypothetical protein
MGSNLVYYSVSEWNLIRPVDKGSILDCSALFHWNRFVQVGVYHGGRLDLWRML